MAGQGKVSKTRIYIYIHKNEHMQRLNFQPVFLPPLDPMWHGNALGKIATESEVRTGYEGWLFRYARERTWVGWSWARVGLHTYIHTSHSRRKVGSPRISGGEEAIRNVEVE